MNTLYTIIGLFALGAIVGIYLLTLVLQSKETPKAAVFVHGLFVAVALIMLIVYITKNPGPMESLVLFILAALGGIVLVYRDLTGQKIPKWLAVVHGLAAVAGFAFLLVFTFMH
jgi:peptidoglycan/LPS O-acetylase OafA/YrhL